MILILCLLKLGALNYVNVQVTMVTLQMWAGQEPGMKSCGRIPSGGRKRFGGAFDWLMLHQTSESDQSKDCSLVELSIPVPFATSASHFWRTSLNS